MIPPLPVIFLWGLIVLILFRQCKPSVALCVSVIGGYLFLPHGTTYNLPVLPAIDKVSMTVLAALLGALLFARGKSAETGELPGFIPRDTFMRVLLVVLVVGIFMTVLTNRDPLFYGPTVLPAMGLYGGFASLQGLIVGLLPVVLARKYLATPEGQKTLLFCLFVGGMLYILPILFEVRMSPQLNMIIYGYFPHNWLQHLRDGGYRPIVFLQHGLWVSIMMSMAVLAALGCARLATPQRRVFFLGLAAVLLVTLVLTKSLGAFLITLVISPIVLFGTVRLQMLFASAVLIFTLLYPMVRSSQVVSVDQVTELASKFAFTAKRAGSLNFRLVNEEEMLEKLNDRPMFGWGGWGRSSTYNEEGRRLNITDSFWIIQLGERGWAGYLAFYGLLIAPALLLTFRKRCYEVTLATSALCLVLTANMVDMLVNATLTPVTLLVAGSLIGQLELRRGAEIGQEKPRLRPKQQYSRPRPEHIRPPDAVARQGLPHQRPVRPVKP